MLNCTNKEKDLLARIMRAEALGEGNLGMIMVGDVVVNRVIANCYNFNNIRTITDAIYEKNQFSGIHSSLFYGRPTKLEKRLAEQVLRGEKYFPGECSLWFKACKKNNNCDKTWYSKPLAGIYKNHCFYKPNKEECQEIFIN